MPLATPPTTPPPTTDHLLTFLADRDSPCPACGYSLRDLRSPVCPECGEALELRVGLVEPRLGWWLAGVIGAAAPCGFTGLLMAFFLVAVLPKGRDPHWVRFLIVDGAELVASVALLAAWIRYRSRFRRLRLAARATCAVLTWAFAVGTLTVFAATLG